jgi:hypothetical protein
MRVPNIDSVTAGVKGRESLNERENREASSETGTETGSAVPVSLSLSAPS